MATTAKKKTKPEEAQAKGPAVSKIGNLTVDPELRFGESTHKPYARMRLAVSTPVEPGNWSGGRTTTYYDVTAFGSLAENAAESLTKGARVVVTGRGEVRTWTGDDGTEHKEKGILADAIGPDLRWATAQVTKAAHPKASATSEETACDDEDF